MEESSQQEQILDTRLIRTTHSEDGTSVFATDDKLAPFAPLGPGRSVFTVFDSRASIPVNNKDAIPIFSPMIPRCPEKGAIFCTADLQAGDSSPMHRTDSIDYCIVLSGEILLKLDGGEERTVKAGEFIVQQGVNHQWVNNTKQICRIAFVMVASQKLVADDGQPMKSTVP
ncbi:hypothetical protein CC79DRAFT_1331553 [Sarocladium strictum]|jgi:quercetin dioxygenase-like cupin family protein